MNEKLKAIIEALRDRGMTIPDEVVDYTTLVVAIKANAGGNFI